MKAVLIKIWACALSFLYLFVLPWNSQVQPNRIPETRSFKGEVPDKYGVWPTEKFEQGEKPWWLAPRLLELRYHLARYDRGNGDTIDSFLILYKGRIVYERHNNEAYGADTPHFVASVTKSVTSALVGIAIGEGLIGGVEDKVLAYFPEAAGMPGWEESKREMTIEHLLTMNSGIITDGDAAAWDGYFAEDLEDSALYAFLRPQAYPPGVKHKYENIAPSILLGIIQRASGRPFLEYAQEKLFAPLGMESVEWETAADGLPFGAFGIDMSPHDMARFGYLYLNYGRWEGAQIIPADYVKRTPSKSISPKAYGYLFWNHKMTPFRGFYEANGADGQYIVIMPGRNMVVVCTGSDRKETGIKTFREMVRGIFGK